MVRKVRSRQPWSHLLTGSTPGQRTRKLIGANIVAGEPRVPLVAYALLGEQKLAESLSRRYGCVAHR